MALTYIQEQFVYTSVNSKTLSILKLIIEANMQIIYKTEILLKDIYKKVMWFYLIGNPVYIGSVLWLLSIIIIKNKFLSFNLLYYRALV